jgi:5-methylcytosine-specific restriction protein A
MTRPTNRVHRNAFTGHSERWHSENQARVRAHRDPVVAALYATPQWKVLRALVLAESNYICASPNCRRRAVVADHIKAHKGMSARFFDRANLQPLCKSCHDRKTARMDGGYGNRQRKDYWRTPDTHDGGAPGAGQPGARIQGGDFEVFKRSVGSVTSTRFSISPIEDFYVGHKKVQRDLTLRERVTARLTSAEKPAGPAKAAPGDVKASTPGARRLQNRIVRS